MTGTASVVVIWLKLYFDIFIPFLKKKVGKCKQCKTMLLSFLYTTDAQNANFLSTHSKLSYIMKLGSQEKRNFKFDKQNVKEE